MAGKDWKSDATEMGDSDDKKPAKVLSHIETRKAKNGGHIHTHHHSHPHHHPAEEHITSTDKAMMAHMQASMGAGAPADGDPTGGAPADPSAAAAPAGAPAPAAGAPGPAAGAAGPAAGGM